MKTISTIHLVKLFFVSQFSFITITISFAQKEFSNWYFGNGAGIDFSSGSPVAVNNGKLFTEEGCATISDFAGNLLFYTNGITVWDRFHNPMPNGFDLAGGISSTQSAIILPVPGSNSKYYIFTIGEKAGVNGLSYSVLDLLAGSDKKLFTRNQNILLTPDIILAAAKPDVVKKNIRLVSPVSEKLTAVKNGSGDGFWVIVHQWNTDAFYVFPVTVSGVGKPVISNTGVVHKESGAGYNRESIGCLVASPDEKKLGSAICYKPGNEIELFDIDKNTGRISNPRKIATGGFAYGLAFSTDNSKLYASFLKGEQGIVQYDLTSDDPASSGKVIAYNKIENIVLGALQLGPDQKIYVAKTGNFLDVIHKPNEKGAACGYDEDGVNLGGRYSVYGLPALVLTLPQNAGSEIAPKPVSLTAIPDCKGAIPVVPLPADTEVYCINELKLDAGNPGAVFSWSTGETTRSINVKESGKFTVKVEKDGCSSTKSIRVEFAARKSNFSYLPEFNPSNAMLNNSFQYSVNDVLSFEIKIFSPKGKPVFESDNPKKYWSGKDEKGKVMPKGEYKWVVKYRPKCGDQSTETREGIVRLKNEVK